MIPNPDDNLHVYMVSVGQGDTTIIVSPRGSVTVIDVIRPAKVVKLLRDLGMNLQDTIEHLILTHPHDDHFGGANRLAADFRIAEATVAPFWHEFGMGPSSYRSIIGRLADQGTNTTFLSGYSRWYPDGALTSADPPEIDPDRPFLEMLGPTNGLVEELEAANVFNANHLSIMSRLTWRKFRMIITGDAQMENWGHFDHERMLEDGCNVLRAAHHGSANGTQFERIMRLSPSQVIVSSDPGSGHHLPDLSSAAIFARYDRDGGHAAVITRDTGTVHMTVRPTGTRKFERYGETPTQNVDLGNPVALDEASNPTDWAALVNTRVAEL